MSEIMDVYGMTQIGMVMVHDKSHNNKVWHLTVIERIFKYFDGSEAGGQTDGGITKEEWVSGFATFIKGHPSYLSYIHLR